MKVFISWSGDVSRKVAEVLRDWLPSVIQAIDPYVSSEDIDKGARWSADISQELEESNYGILCVTRTNLGAPWLNFEAGALSKSFDKSRVSPFLFEIERKDVTGPLLQFQSTIYEKEDLRKLIRSINSSCESGLDEARLDQIFDVWWPSLTEKLDSIANTATPTAEGSSATKRSSEEVLSEILSLVRTQQKILADQTEVLPSIESFLRSRAVNLSGPPPRTLVRDLSRHWYSLWKQLTILADTNKEDTAIQKLLVRAHECDRTMNYLVDIYELRQRASDRNRRTLFNLENAAGNSKEGG